MTTSLAEQLQKLSVPQSSVYKDGTKQASLLFDPKDAAEKDRDIFYEIGVSGLQSLITLFEGFSYFKDSLFSLASKDFERAVESKEANRRLGEVIEKFLRLLSPYFQLQSAHKALEWLVNRYQIHQYNQDAVMALILPYHETMTFVRFIQIMDIKDNSNRWNWLEPLQKQGIPLAKQVLYNQCASDSALLKFIAKNTETHVKKFGERATKLNTVYAFFCSAAIGAVDGRKHNSESIINALLPTVMKALASPIDDFRSSGYIVVGYLCSKLSLKEATLNEIVERILNSELTLSYEMVLLVNLIYSKQFHLKTLSDGVLYDLSVDRFQLACMHLKTLASQKISVMSFAITFLQSVLPLMQTDLEEFKRLHKLPEILLSDVDFSSQSPKEIIKVVLNSYKKPTSKNTDGYGSDIEIIDEDNGIIAWYSVLLRDLEQKYPDAFDIVIKSELNTENNFPVQRHSQLSKILLFKPAFVHKIGETYLFENLNHPNPELRIQAVKYIAEHFITVKLQDITFLKESIISRCSDEDPKVVMTVLGIPILYIEEVLTPDELTKCFISIVSKKGPSSKKWIKVVQKAVDVFCSLDNLMVNHGTVLTLLPYLFPKNVKSATLALQIIKSEWGQKYNLTSSAKNYIEKRKNLPDVKLHEVVLESVFAALENAKPQHLGIGDYNDLDRSDTLNVSLYLFMKSFTLKYGSVEECTHFLNDIVEFAGTREIIPNPGSSILTGELMVKCVKLCEEDKILFPIVEHLFDRIIQNCGINNISKPWYNVCGSSEGILLKQIFEICITGCAIPTYSENYCSLLQKLLNKICSNAREKVEFIANIACGHILFAEKPEDTISPELQLRSLKFLNDCIQQFPASEMPWILKSNVVIALLFDLNNPLSAIRQCAIDTITNIFYKYEESDAFITLFKHLLLRNNELLLDHEQVLQVLYLLLSEDQLARSNMDKSEVQKMKKCLKILIQTVTDMNTPAHVSSELLALLARINNTEIFTQLASVAGRLHNSTARVLDVYESKLLRNIYSRITIESVQSFETDKVWTVFGGGLKQYKESVLNEYESFVSPCYSILKQFDSETFSALSEDKASNFVSLICSAGTYSNSPEIVSVAAKLMKKIDLKMEHFQDILLSMVAVKDPGAAESKSKSTAVAMLSYQTAETDEWKLGVTVLEYIQNKKRLIMADRLLPLLFKLLQKCLEFEEQSYVEYTKQLILSSVWFYCQKFLNSINSKFVGSKDLKTIRTGFDIELVVKCIRGTQNPQTHHHALMLLSQAAHMLPEQVLNHTMAIFTFIGSSVLMRDDDYSFKIIIKIIETIVPILVNLDKLLDFSNERGLKQLEVRVVPVLRIFADVVLDVPEHRRLILYKKLIETLQAKHFLWVFIALMLETHLCHWKETVNKQVSEERSLASQEMPINRLDFGQSLVLEFPADVILENYIKLIKYLKTLPHKKDDNMMETDVDPADIFSVAGHTDLQLRHYKYIIVTFMNTCLSSPYFIQHSHSAQNVDQIEQFYKTFIIDILMFIQSVSKIQDEVDDGKTGQYWRVMLHYSYDLLDNVNNLLSGPMFVSVVRGLLSYTLPTVRRKAMELLNSKIQHSPELFAECDTGLLYSLLPALMEIVKTIDKQDKDVSEKLATKIELNQQMALLSLKLMTRLLAAKDPQPFKPILESITDYTCSESISGNVMASVVLCLAELCSSLKAHAIFCLPKFMPGLINILKNQRKEETPELIMLSSITAVCKIVENLPLFLSPYLKKILYEYSILLARWQKLDQECSKVSAVVTKLTIIKKKIASSVAPRVLIPVTNECYRKHLKKGYLYAIGPVMAVLAESFSYMTTADFTALQHDLTTFFLSALQLRSDFTESDDASDVDSAEDEIVNALVCLVLKLSETSFRPFYFKIYDWAIRTNVDEQKDRAITFYRLSSAIADKLKGLFVLFAGHFIQNAAHLLDECNKSKTEDLYFESEEKCGTLVEYILKTLRIVFLYDSQNFVNKDRFETLMQPIVDQLENTLGGLSALQGRCKELLGPCISQFAVAIADDSLWKPLNYQILLKTRHNEAEIRMLALQCLVSMATQLGGAWLPLLAESVPFLSELLEDGDSRIEQATKDAIRKLETVLEEPLEKYF